VEVAKATSTTVSGPVDRQPAAGVRVLHVVLFDEEDESPFAGMLKVEAA